MTKAALTLAALFIAGCSGNDAAYLKVYKYDGSAQCEGAGASVEEMQRELTDAGVPVFCGQKAGDGYAYAAVCGASTGMINVYTIDASDLAKAEDLGFNSTAELPDYQDEVCPAEQ
jgi:hypothetical protein